jgi:hypothetical protein
MAEPDTPGSGGVQTLMPQEARDRLAEDAGTAAGAAQDSFEAVKDEAVTQFNAIKDEAQSQLANATDKAKGFAGEQKDAAGDQLGGVAAAITRVADELGDQPAVAGYARELAGGLQRVSDTVKNNNVDELLAMAEDFGRTQPVAFLGAAALAGFVASRFVLASANRRKATADTTNRSVDGDTGAASGPSNDTSTSPQLGGAS